MIKQLLRAIAIVGEYLAVGTVLAQLVILFALNANDAFTEEKLFKVKALLANVDLYEVRKSAQQEMDPTQGTSIQAVPKDVVVLLREDGVQIGAARLEQIRSGLRRERKRYDVLREEFRDRLEEREQIAIASSRRDLQNAIEVMDAKQARVQLIAMIDDGGLEDVVSILDMMPDAKKSRIFAEFKEPGDAARLHKILLELRGEDESAASAAGNGGAGNGGAGSP